MRYTIAETARREVLGRLLRLNHARHAAEVAAGLVDASGKRVRGKRPHPPAPSPARRGGTRGGAVVAEEKVGYAEGLFGEE